MKETLPAPRAIPDVSSREVATRTIGEAWLSIARRILVDGVASSYDGLAIRELTMMTLHVTDPRSDDELIVRWADPARLAWMHSNFTDSARVAALGDADSYATRLFDYEHRGLDQIEWVIRRLSADATTRSATITTLQPLTDTTYIPCVSLLDFFVIQGRLELVVYAHSIDFGTKGFANLVELAHLQQRVGEQISARIGSLTMIVKSAHVYESDIDDTSDILSASGETA